MPGVSVPGPSRVPVPLSWSTSSFTASCSVPPASRFTRALLLMWSAASGAPLAPSAVRLSTPPLLMLTVPAVMRPASVALPVTVTAPPASVLPTSMRAPSPSVLPLPPPVWVVNVNAPSSVPPRVKRRTACAAPMRSVAPVATVTVVPLPPETSALPLLISSVAPALTLRFKVARSTLLLITLAPLPPLSTLTVPAPRSAPTTAPDCRL